MHIYSKGFFSCFAILFALAFTACVGSQSDGYATDEDRWVAEIFDQQQDSMLLNSPEAQKRIIALQGSVTDSANFYKLELMRANLLINTPDANDCIEAFGNVRQYIGHNRNDELEMLYWNYYANFLLFNMGQRDSARNCYSRAYALAQQQGSKLRQVNIAINVADAYRLTGDPAHASIFYHKAYALLDSLGTNREIFFNINIGLGQTYAEIASYDQAEHYFELAGEMIDGVAPYDRFLFHNSYGNALYFAQRYDEAIDHFEQARLLAAPLDHPAPKCIAATNLCEVNLVKGDIAVAHRHLDEALMWLEQLPDDAVLHFYIYSLAADLSLSENDLPQARRYLAQAGDTTLVGPREMALHYSRLQRLSARLYDYANAYLYQQRASYYENLINNDRSRKQIAEMEMRYRHDTTIMNQRLVISEKETEVRTLEVQIFIIVTVAIIAGAALVIYLMHKRRQRTLGEIALRQSLYSMRLANIRNRISPHFVFNVLNRELRNDNPGIRNLVNLLRTNLQLCDRYIIPLSEEIAFVDNYVEVEAPALGDNFAYTKHIAPQIDLDTVLIPSMMVQIFAENAIKHSIRGFDGAKRLDIAVARNADATVITIENEGAQHLRSNAASSTKTGMKVVTQTINLLNELNPRKIDLAVSQKVNEDRNTATFKVEIKIPDGYNFTKLG